LTAGGNTHSFVVAGAGALGSAFGAVLRLAGHRVALLGRNRAHTEAVRDSGLRLTGLWGERTADGLTAHTDPGDVPDADYCLVTTKSFDTRGVVEALAPRMGRAQFVSLQNGVGNTEEIARQVGAERTVGGMVIIGFEVREPGTVAVTVIGGDVLVGRPDAKEGDETDPEVCRLADALATALGGTGATARATDNIRGAIWGKVLYNCALNALGAVLDVPYGELASGPTWSVIEDVVTEAFEVALAEGVRLPWQDAPGYLALLKGRQLPATAGHRASMLQDLKRGRRTEIDYMNGAVARLGAEHGIATPVNAALTQLVKFLEAHRDGRRG
jgi:2-dehydropantoate 2-reductase